MEIIENFSDPLVIGAACAAVNQITIKSVFTYKSVLVAITNGTRQVCELHLSRGTLAIILLLLYIATYITILYVHI